MVERVDNLMPAFFNGLKIFMKPRHAFGVNGRDATHTQSYWDAKRKSVNSSVILDS
jgi:hypothetical protein